MHQFRLWHHKGFDVPNFTIFNFQLLINQTTRTKKKLHLIMKPHTGPTSTRARRLVHYADPLMHRAQLKGERPCRNPTRNHFPPPPSPWGPIRRSSTATGPEATPGQWHHRSSAWGSASSRALLWFMHLRRPNGLFTPTSDVKGKDCRGGGEGRGGAWAHLRLTDGLVGPSVAWPIGEEPSKTRWRHRRQARNKEALRCLIMAAQKNEPGMMSSRDPPPPLPHHPLPNDPYTHIHTHSTHCG